MTRDKYFFTAKHTPHSSISWTNWAIMVTHSKWWPNVALSKHLGVYIICTCQSERKMICLHCQLALLPWALNYQLHCIKRVASLSFGGLLKYQLFWTKFHENGIVAAIYSIMIPLLVVEKHLRMGHILILFAPKKVTKNHAYYCSSNWIKQSKVSPSSHIWMS